MGKGSPKQEVSEFSMSIHLGLCHGPVDAVTGLFVGEKLAWEGEATEQGGIYINAPSLFGGPKEEGGVGGNMYYLPGGADQVMPDGLAERFGLTSATCPGFRGIASVFFVGRFGALPGEVYTGGTSGGLPGGGSTGGGGGGAFPIGGNGSCVWTEATLPDGRKASEVTGGDVMRVLGGDATVVGAKVQNDVPCVTLVSFTGIEKTVSKTTPFTCEDGRVISVMDSIDHLCGTEDDDGFRWERIVEVREAGRRSVVLIDLGGETFAAGDKPGRYLYTHNKTYLPSD